MLRSKLLYCFLVLPLVAGMVLHPAALQNFATVSYQRHLSSALLLFLVSFGAVRKRSVIPSAIPMVLIFGYIIAVTSGVFAASIVGFLILGSAVTKIGQKIKREFDVDFKEDGQRNWVQVVSNCGVVTVICLVQIISVGHGEGSVDFRNFIDASSDSVPSPRSLLMSLIHLSVLGASACCAADTFASELAPVFSSHPPVLLTEPWRHVPTGTNGGVTLFGLVISLIGGGLQGLIHFIATVLLCSNGSSVRLLILSQWPLVPLGALAGLLGSLTDSLFGATLQFSGVVQSTNKVTEVPGPNVKYISGRAILDNNLVNFFSSLTTAVLLPLLASHLFF